MDKYPTTFHLPFSPGITNEDSVINEHDINNMSFIKKESDEENNDLIIITEKIDGGNCCIKNGQIYARTHSKPTIHWSFGRIKEIYEQQIKCYDIDHLEIYGENMTCTHSITYNNLISPFYLFGIYNTIAKKWLSWKQIEYYAKLFNIPTVPVVYIGPKLSITDLKKMIIKESKLISRLSNDVLPEGFVVRLFDEFTTFNTNIAKYVRKDHIQTTDSWDNKENKADIKTTIPINIREPILQYTIYCDLDGTLVDFEKKVDELGLTGAHNNKLWPALKNVHNFFGSLEWINNAELLWKTIEPYNPIILTGLPMEGDWAAIQKKQWCAKNLGSHIQVICCKSSEKQQYCKKFNILIDDRLQLKEKWELMGGIFIHHTTVTNTIQQLYDLNIITSSSFTTFTTAISIKPTIISSVSPSTPIHITPITPIISSTTPVSNYVIKNNLKLLILIGVPGSGKTTFSKKLSKWIHISQDKEGSKDICEDLIGKYCKTGKNKVILDRCNTSGNEIIKWIKLSMLDKKEIGIIYFNKNIKECEYRVQNRQNHETLKPGNNIMNIITGHKKSMISISELNKITENIFIVNNDMESDLLANKLK